MLQQTRVEAVIPYFERFLASFPTAEALAGSREEEVLAAWSGLGYYSRARNLRLAAQRIASAGIPHSYDAVLDLPGIGPYTAAAIASIALGLPHAAVDGNVIRVISRVTNDAGEISSPAARRRFQAAADALLDRSRPGDFNQAMMELGATICVPTSPRCAQCPVARFCEARSAGRERELPVRLLQKKSREVKLDLALLEQDGKILLIERSKNERRLAGFWELPEKRLFPGFRGAILCRFTHQIVNDRFRVLVWRFRMASAFPEGRWLDSESLLSVPLTTITRKALRSITVPHGPRSESKKAKGHAAS